MCRRLVVLIALGSLMAAACSSTGVEPLVTAPTATTVASTTTARPATTTSTTTASTTTATTAPPPTTSTTVAPPPPGPACAPDDAGCATASLAGETWLAARVTGGTFGFAVIEVGGATTASLNPQHVFYPASSVKAIHHLHAVRWVTAQPEREDALDTPIPRYDDTCAGAGSGTAVPLRTLLDLMLIRPDNEATNAIQDFFGLEALNKTAGEAGMTDTLLAHRFACGGPANDPANASTAWDLASLYRAVASGVLIDRFTELALFTSFMLQNHWPSLDRVITEEAALLDVDPARFIADTSLIYKAGWWETNLSVGGLLEISSCEGVHSYAFGAFVDRADAVVGGFDIADVIPEVLRAEIGAALESYMECGP